MSYNKFDKDSLSVPQPTGDIPSHPKSTLLAQGWSMIQESTAWWEKLLFLLFMTLQLVIPLLTNWMNVQMVQGAYHHYAMAFSVIHIFQVMVDVFRGCFYMRVATRLQTLFLKSGLAHYASLSKPSRFSNPAYNFTKFLQEASWSINHLVEWGLFAMGSMVGQSVSAGILLFVFDLEWIDYIVLPIAIAIAFYVIRKLQKLLTDRQQISREIGESTTNLEQLNAMKLQNGDIGAKEIGEFLLKSIHYDNRFVRLLYNYIGCTLELALELVTLAYAIYLPNDRAFLAKLILIRTISSALNSVTHFLSQYDRYFNQYLKYRKHFDKTDLTYDELHEQLPIPEEGLTIISVSIKRGENYSIEGGNIPIQHGKHILVQGPSGAGKTSLVDALRGFIPGVTLLIGVSGNFSKQICIHAQSCASLVQLTSVSFADLFGTSDVNDFERIHVLFEIVFQKSELTRILDNISKENPFQTKIEGKL